MAIDRFRHRGLEKFFFTGRTTGIEPRHAARLRLILGRLSVATVARDVLLPGWAAHPLKGDRHGDWSIKVSGNWRVTFRFVEGGVTDVDYEDYH